MVSGKEIIIICSKLFALYLFIQLIMTLEFFVAPLFGDQEYFTEMLIYYLFRTSIHLGLILILMWRSQEVANLLMANEREINVALPVSKFVAFELAFIIVGTFVVVETLPYVLTNIYNWLKLELKEEFDYNFRTTNGNLIYTILKLTIGILVVTNSSYLSRLLSAEGTGKVSDQ